MKLKKLFDLTLILYVIIGILNFIICTGLMFILYNIVDISQHIAPIVNYGLGSVIWYLSCRFILFRDHKTTSGQLFRFVLEVIICYLLSYYVISPLVSDLLLRSEAVRELFSFGGVDNIGGNCSMSVGALSYALLNYFGQRYFVFSSRFDRQKPHTDS